MAMDSDNCEFWLPPNLLTDDDGGDLFSEFNSEKTDAGTNKTLSSSYYPRLEASPSFGFYPPTHKRSGTFDGSTKTGNEAEDNITDLTRKLSISSLRESGLISEHNKDPGSAISPKSTLYSRLGGCNGCNPNCSCQASSTRGTKKDEVTLSLLYAASIEESLKVSSLKSYLHALKNGLIQPTRPPEPVSEVHGPFPRVDFQRQQFLVSNRTNPHLTVLQKSQFEHLKRQQMTKLERNGSWSQKLPEYGSQEMWQDIRSIAAGKPHASLAAATSPLLKSHQLQQPQGTEFLGNSRSKSRYAGTGVFLPQTCGAPATDRKKPGTPTVFLFGRVVHPVRYAEPIYHTCNHKSSIPTD